MRNFKRLLSVSAATILALQAAPALASTTIDFETTGGGSPTAAGAPVGNDYATLGLTFGNAFYFQCGGGCPAPPGGHFISGPGTSSPFTVLFNGTTNSFSFANVSFSNGSATAYDINGILLQTLSFSAYPGTFSFAATGIHSVTFSGGQYGVDNFTFGELIGVPEPSTWAMMLLGFGAIGWSMRRRKAPRLAAA